MVSLLAVGLPKSRCSQNRAAASFLQQQSTMSPAWRPSGRAGKFIGDKMGDASLVLFDLHNFGLDV